MARFCFLVVLFSILCSLVFCQHGLMTIVRPFELRLDHFSTFLYMGSVPIVSLFLLRKFSHTYFVPIIYLTGSCMGFLSRSYYYTLLVFITRFLFDQEPPFMENILKNYNQIASLDFFEIMDRCCNIMSAESTKSKSASTGKKP